MSDQPDKSPGASLIEKTLRQELRVSAPPFWMIGGLLVLVVASWLPLALIGYARTHHSSKPRVHLIQDMDVQPKYGAQDDSPVFADGRAMRPPVPGTVARGHLEEDDFFNRGYTATRDENGQWQITYLDGFPPQVNIDARTMQRGRTVFNIYCAVCHGEDGYGKGPIHERAVLRQEPNWVPPSDLHAIDPETGKPRLGKDLYETGRLFNVITNGVRNMSGYGSQIKPQDRWAVILYLRALQRSQFATLEDVPAEQRGTLR